MDTAVPRQATAAPDARVLSAHALVLPLQPREPRLYRLQPSRFRLMVPVGAPQGKRVKAATLETAAQNTATVEALHFIAQAPASPLSVPALLR